VKWHHYELVRIDYVPTEKGKAEAKKVSAALLASKPQRIRQFSELLLANDIDQDVDQEAGLRSVYDFFLQNAELSPGAQTLSDTWESFAVDLGLVLGDQMITRKPYLKWAFLDGDKRQLDAWQTGLTGFEYGIRSPPFFMAQSGNAALAGTDCSNNLDYAFGWS
jgi:hypothetical protein